MAFFMLLVVIYCTFTWNFTTNLNIVLNIAQVRISINKIFHMYF